MRQEIVLRTAANNLAIMTTLPIDNEYDDHDSEDYDDYNDDDEDDENSEDDDETC